MDGEVKNELILEQKITDMIAYSYIVLKNFPKSEKFALAADIKLIEDRILERCIEAKKKYTKKTTLQDMDIAVEKLKVYIRLSYSLKFINNHTYFVWSTKVVEIGKMLGGWIKTVNNQHPQHKE
jgi:four helix bundle protein